MSIFAGAQLFGMICSSDVGWPHARICGTNTPFDTWKSVPPPHPPALACPSWHNGLVKSHFVSGIIKFPRESAKDPLESPRVVFLCSVLCGYSTRGVEGTAAKACHNPPCVLLAARAPPASYPPPVAHAARPSPHSHPSPWLPVIPLCEARSSIYRGINKRSYPTLPYPPLLAAARRPVIRVKLGLSRPSGDSAHCNS